ANVESTVDRNSTGENTVERVAAIEVGVADGDRAARLIVITVTDGQVAVDRDVASRLVERIGRDVEVGNRDVAAGGRDGAAGDTQKAGVVDVAGEGGGAGIEVGVADVELSARLIERAAGDRQIVAASVNGTRGDVEVAAANSKAGGVGQRAASDIQ